jgi:hypothetical protein
MEALGYILMASALAASVGVIVVSMLTLPRPRDDDDGGVQPPYDLGPTLGGTMRPHVEELLRVPHHDRSLHSDRIEA